jgi:chromosome segregation ATPase
MAQRVPAAADGRMSETDSIEMASRRLALALDALEAAAERRREADLSEEALSSQIHALGTDRARLASDLDQATARSRALEIANREVAQRIAQAIETIRSVLGPEE